MRIYIRVSSFCVFLHSQISQKTYKNPQSIYDICILTHDSIRTLTILEQFYVHIVY